MHRQLSLLRWAGIAALLLGGCVTTDRHHDHTMLWDAGADRAIGCGYHDHETMWVEPPEDGLALTSLVASYALQAVDPNQQQLVGTVVPDVVTLTFDTSGATAVEGLPLNEVISEPVEACANHPVVYRVRGAMVSDQPSEAGASRAHDLGVAWTVLPDEALLYTENQPDVEPRFSWRHARLTTPEDEALLQDVMMLPDGEVDGALYGTLWGQLTLSTGLEMPDVGAASFSLGLGVHQATWRERPEDDEPELVARSVSRVGDFVATRLP